MIPDMQQRVPAALLRGVGGIDEAGRGPLAGPVVAAVVVLAPGQIIEGVTDSKLLPAARRKSLAVDIRAQSLAWALGSATVEEIDRLNILHATLLAMRRAVEALNAWPERLRVDGNRAPSLPGYPGVVETLVQGDRLCPSISAASILAKVARDDVMLKLDAEFPGYGFAVHKGYPTADHRAALQRLGACAAHRRSFGPVRAALQSGCVA